LKYKAVMFDLDDTLVVENEAAKQAFSQTCSEAQNLCGVDPLLLFQTLIETCRNLWETSALWPYLKNIGISDWEGMWGVFKGEHENMKRLHSWAPKYRFQSWNLSLEKCGIKDESLAKRLDQIHQQERRKLHRVFPDVIPCLEILKKSCRLCILSNGAPDLQREKMSGAKIDRFFNTLVISGGIGIGKPNPEIFRFALHKMNLSSSESLMVGDNLKTDILGANNAGIPTVWLNREEQDRDDAFIPTYEIKTLEEITRIV